MKVLRERLRCELIAMEGFVRRQLDLSRRYLEWELVFLFYAIVNALTIGLIGASSGDRDRILFLTVGAVLWSFLSVIFHEVAAAIALERWEGTIEYTFMAPVHRVTHMVGVCLGAVVYGTARTLLVLAAVALFLDLSLEHANLWSAAVVLGTTSVSFMGLGIMAATLPMLSPDKGAQATHIVQACMGQHKHSCISGQTSVM